MRKILIKLILKIKNILPSKYAFSFMGFFSSFYGYIKIIEDGVVFSKNKKKYKKYIKEINFGEKEIFVFLYTTDYKDIHQRPQHLAKAFSRNGDSIVFFMTNNQTKDTINGIEKEEENLYLVSNYKIINLLSNFNLIIVGPSHFRMLNYLENYKKLIYDFPDELDFFPGISRKNIEKNHLELLKKSDLVTPSAGFLEKIILDEYPDANTKVVLNGVFPEDFILTEKDNNVTPQDFKNILLENKKIVGFYGGLGEGWIDFELLKYISDNRENYTFIIIGGGNIDYFIKKYDFGKNIYFLGPKKYIDLKNYAKFFDVAIIPFKINNLTLGVSPVKSFEYMVQGIPFVSTALPECKKYKNVLIADNYNDFLVKIDEGIILKNSADYVSGLKYEGMKNTWISRVKTITSFLL